ncbi:hypothetical protein Cni_G16615 [Canna indica]|uniref:Uncharacterized protein n=1 Tax=Canna indica TaxID=4628 RepID=A0AAQ3QCQ3_9LILI|nr:hypothetical protein Cni_G16615 [Canna indica]
MRKQKAPIKCYRSTIEEGRQEDQLTPINGFVPVLVGDRGEELQRFLVSVEGLKHPCFVRLLEMAAEEFGYGQRGVLRIPCDAQHFEQVIAKISKSK